MKIERRITPNRFETNSRARKLRNSSSVKLGTFPSYSPSLSFFLSFLSLPLSIFFFYFRTLPVSRDAYTNFLSFSSLYETVLLPSPSFFFSYASFVTPSFPPIPLSPPTCSSAESTIAGRCSFFLCKRAPRERKLADLRALPLPTLVRKHTGRKC